MNEQEKELMELARELRRIGSGMNPQVVGVLQRSAKYLDALRTMIEEWRLNQ